VGGDLVYNRIMCFFSIFQSTPPRGGRQKIIEL